MSNNNDFFMNFKLPTHLPNEKPKTDMSPPASLPSKPPATLPAIPKINKPSSKSQPTTVIKHSSPDAAHDDVAEDEDDEEVVEEEAFVKVKDKNEPIPIPGTTIVLNTDEDIAKWIEERKKNWPSRKRVEEKKLENSAKRSNNDVTNSPIKKQKRYCKFFIKGNCRNQHCVNLHEIPIKPLASHKLIYHHYVPINIPERYSKSINSGKSLHNLVIEHDYYTVENDKVLNVIEKLVQNGYIKPNYEKYKKA